MCTMLILQILNLLLEQSCFLLQIRLKLCEDTTGGMDTKLVGS